LSDQQVSCRWPWTDPPSLLADIEQARRYGSYVLFFASLPSLTLPGLVAKIFDVDDLIGLGRLIAATAPLTAAVTVVGIAALGRRIEFLWLIAIAAFSLLGSLFLGLMIGDSLPRAEILAIKDYNLLPFIFSILTVYYRHYGGWSFATSLSSADGWPGCGRRCSGLA